MILIHAISIDFWKSEVSVFKIHIGWETFKTKKLSGDDIFFLVTP